MLVDFWQALQHSLPGLSIQFLLALVVLVELVARPQQLLPHFLQSCRAAQLLHPPQQAAVVGIGTHLQAVLLERQGALAAAAHKQHLLVLALQDKEIQVALAPTRQWAMAVAAVVVLALLVPTVPALRAATAATELHRL